jgi:hypothetical protein
VTHELRAFEWLCACRENRVHSKSCLKCLRCGCDKPDPVTLGKACWALGVYHRACSLGKTPAEAMHEMLTEYENARGQR